MKAVLNSYLLNAAEVAWAFASQDISPPLATLVGRCLITEMVLPAMYCEVALALVVLTLTHRVKGRC